MTKQLDEQAMQRELSGSAFFRTEPEKGNLPDSEAATKTAGLAATMPPRPLAGNPATMPPRAHATMPPRSEDGLIEGIRKTVKQLGKEEATYRITAEEKKAVADIVYAYTSSGTRISNNEVTRIGLAFLLADYRQHGAASVLARVLESLHS